MFHHTRITDGTSWLVCANGLPEILKPNNEWPKK